MMLSNSTETKNVFANVKSEKETSFVTILQKLNFDQTLIFGNSCQQCYQLFLIAQNLNNLLDCLTVEFNHSLNTVQ